ncbi:DUF1054 family protein, partial [Macrococcus hajekii]
VNVAALWHQRLQQILELPDDFIMKKDHMKEDYMLMSDVSEDELKKSIQRLKDVKKGELLFGKVYHPDHPSLKSDQVFINEIEETFIKLLQLQ